MNAPRVRPCGRRDTATRLAALPLAALLLLAAPVAHAAGVTLPLELDFSFLRDTLVRQLYTAPGPSAPVLDDGHDCARLALFDPRFDDAAGRLRLRTLARARLGTWLAQRCTLPIDWDGEIEVLLEPLVEPGSGSLRFRVIDSRVRRPDGGSAAISGVLWSWIKGSVHPLLGSFHVDLARPLADLRTFLPLVIPESDSSRTQRLVDSVALAGARVTVAGVVADLRFEAPERTQETERARAAEAPLGDEEIARFSERLQHWDAFLTFVLLHAARDTTATGVRRELLAVLLDAREELVDALAEPAMAGPDPVRTLFLSTWTRLAPVLRRIDTGLSVDASLHYLAFIAAADALAALDRLGPAAGLEISTSGLRRMARMIAPSEAVDPLAFDDAVDPALREIFEFGEPIELPPPDEGASAAAPHFARSRRHSQGRWPRGIGDSMPLARASWTLAQRTVTSGERSRFRTWVPTAADLGEYLPLVRAVLDEAAEKAAAKTKLEARFDPVYGWLVLAAAWKESCWRQLVLRDGRPVALRSSAGAVGILQVSPRVWRGFYDSRALEADLPYNARAGAEILAHYLTDYAIPADEHGRAGTLDALARATYAAYNGGPAALRRWRNSGARPDLRKIDEAFWNEYQSVKQTGDPNLASCWGA